MQFGVGVSGHYSGQDLLDLLHLDRVSHYHRDDADWPCGPVRVRSNRDLIFDALSILFCREIMRARIYLDK